MSMEDLEPRPVRGETLGALMREDLDPWSVEDLQNRIATLEAEVARAKAAIERKNARRSDADALFRFNS